MVEPLKCHVCGKEVNKLILIEDKLWVCQDCHTWLTVEMEEIEVEEYTNGSDCY